ncbi:MAG TPA: DUF4390 domain-containing protein [Rudaea sp.]|jgi:hypothetical protein|uniref:DUF4390 domain-containing protein n=1 Tax=Rudaea sp. TaxID=2136325 RepID=UPI002F92B124
MRLWKKLISILSPIALAACVQAPAAGAFAVRAAAIEYGQLNAQIDWQPSAVLLDALDHGIALDFAITLKAQAPALLGWQRTLAQTSWHRELRYFPLTRQYQLRDPDGAETRSYAARASLIAAIADLRLDLPASWSVPAMQGGTAQRYSLRIELERDNLPGALRLPALIDASWRLSTGSYTWPVPPTAG